MKVCPVCDQEYSDDSLNFCLNDGSTLEQRNQPPPTVVMDSPRRTNPNYSEFESGFGNPQQQIYQQPFSAPSVSRGQDQTLPTISLILGIAGLVLMCCYAGLPLGAAAMVTGYIGLNNVNKDPMHYGGRGMAIAGMALGAVGVLITLFWIVFIIFTSSL